MDIIACGYGWTGSGAVIAMLRSQEGIALLPHGELQLIKYAGGLASVYSGFRKLGFAGEEVRSNAARVIFGRPVRSWPQAERCRKNMGAFAKEHGKAYRIAADKFLRALNDHSTRPLDWFHNRKFSEYLSEYLREFLALSRPNNERLILDQALKPTDIKPLYFVDAKMIIVDRDPRDSFFDRQLHQKVNTPTLEQYVANLTSRRDKTAHLIEKYADLKDRIRLVRFEEFVLSRDCRKSLCDWLDIEEPKLEGGFFMPDVSCGNIGIHGRAEDKKPYDTIAEMFPGMIWREPIQRLAFA